MGRQIKSFQVGVSLLAQKKHEPSGTTPGIENGNVAAPCIGTNGVQDEVVQGSIPPMLLFNLGHFLVFVFSIQH
jgi:hypothetical protein